MMFSAFVAFPPKQLNTTVPACRGHQVRRPSYYTERLGLHGSHGDSREIVQRRNLALRLLAMIAARKTAGRSRRQRG
jgi:hypothetical protein